MIRHILKILWKNRRHNGLLILELFISFLILTAVFTFLVHTFEKYATPLGFETQNRLMILYYDNSAMDSLEFALKTQQLKATLENEPEVQSVSFGNTIYPFSFSIWSSTMEFNHVNVRFLLAQMDENYQKTMGLTMRAGAWLAPPSESGAYPEIVVNQAFIDQGFNGANMIDSVINLNGNKRIVGVVQHYKYNGEFEAEDPIVIEYISPEDRNAQAIYLHLREEVSPLFEERLNTLVLQTSGIKDFVIKDLDARRQETSRAHWLSVAVLSALGLFLIGNVALGLFGVLWHSISMRRYEISLRKAMGATQGQLMGQFILETCCLAFFAMVLGSILATQVVWFGLTPIPSALIVKGMGMSVVFILVMISGCALYPSWKASVLHPAEGLKEE